MHQLFSRPPTGMQRATALALFKDWPIVPTRRELLQSLPSLKTPSAVSRRLRNLRRRVRPEYLPMWDAAVRRLPEPRVQPLQLALLGNV